MNNIEVIILAGGKGTRMDSPLPKCLVEIDGKPMLSILLHNIKMVLNNKPVVVVGYKADDVKNVLGDKVAYALQKEQKGTGHATSIALEYLKPDAKNIVVLYSDQPFVTSNTIENLILKLKDHKIALATTDADGFSDWKSIFKHHGRIIYSDKGEIEGIIEYKDANEEIRKSSIVNPAFYAFDVAWLKEALKKIQPNNVQGEYYLTDVVKIAREEGLKIGEVKIDPKEALGFNSKEDINLLSKIDIYPQVL